MALHQLVQLEADEASDEGGGGGDGRNNPSSDSLARQAIGCLDAIVGGARIAALW